MGGTAAASGTELNANVSMLAPHVLPLRHQNNVHPPAELARQSRSNHVMAYCASLSPVLQVILT